jgi:proline dehydrogenase
MRIHLNYEAMIFLARNTTRVARGTLAGRLQPKLASFSTLNNNDVSLREKSSITLSHENKISADDSSSTKNPVPDFNDAKSAYEKKTTSELLRAAACFRLCKISILVNNAERLLRMSRSILGGWIVDKALKATLYGHFCAGEDQERIRPVLKRLDEAGIASILDYAAENDGPHVEGGLQSKPEAEANIRVQTYDYESEAQCDRHVETFLHCIKDVASFGADGFAAVKITALGNPKLLARLSTAIVEAKRLFQIFDNNGDGVISRDEFEFGYK